MVSIKQKTQKWSQWRGWNKWNCSPNNWTEHTKERWIHHSRHSRRRCSGFLLHLFSTYSRNGIQSKQNDQSRSNFFSWYLRHRLAHVFRQRTHIIFFFFWVFVSTNRFSILLHGNDIRCMFRVLLREEICIRALDRYLEKRLEARNDCNFSCCATGICMNEIWSASKQYIGFRQQLIGICITSTVDI